ncbi:hypothetical protein HOD08_02345, partial [bacterium]|nr:hypothetical protein [bacterium]
MKFGSNFFYKFLGMAAVALLCASVSRTAFGDGGPSASTSGPDPATKPSLSPSSSKSSLLPSVNLDIGGSDDETLHFSDVEFSSDDQGSKGSVPSKLPKPSVPVASGSSGGQAAPEGSEFEVALGEIQFDEKVKTELKKLWDGLANADDEKKGKLFSAAKNAANGFVDAGMLSEKIVKFVEDNFTKPLVDQRLHLLLPADVDVVLTAIQVAKNLGIDKMVDDFFDADGNIKPEKKKWYSKGKDEDALTEDSEALKTFLGKVSTAEVFNENDNFSEKFIPKFIGVKKTLRSGVDKDKLLGRVKDLNALGDGFNQWLKARGGQRQIKKEELEQLRKEDAPKVPSISIDNADFRENGASASSARSVSSFGGAAASLSDIELESDEAKIQRLKDKK